MVEEKEEHIPLEILIAKYEKDKSEKNKTLLEIGTSSWRQTHNMRLLAAVEADSEATLGEIYLSNLKHAECERKKEEKQNPKKRGIDDEEEQNKGDAKKKKMNVNEVLGKKIEKISIFCLMTIVPLIPILILMRASNLDCQMQTQLLLRIRHCHAAILLPMLLLMPWLLLLSLLIKFPYCEMRRQRAEEWLLMSRRN